MGARNVSAAFAMYPDLAPLPKLLLVWMALKSLDSKSKDGRPPRVYYDGEESLIEAAGRSRSQVYAALAVRREDFVVPFDEVRDDTGRIIGCRDLAQVTA